MSTSDLPVIAFESAQTWREWLAAHHSHSHGIWMRISKKGSRAPSIQYGEALDEALCYGWIDGQKRIFDDESWIQKFTPRRARSGWSRRNTEHAERLVKTGKMQAPGLSEMDAAKRDGRWARAYSSPRAATMPEDFLRELNKNRKAKAFFETLNKRNTYAIVYRLETAKRPETRERRLREIVAMLERGEKFHP